MVAVLFSLLMMVTAIGSGNMPQINNIANVMDTEFNVPKLFTGLFLGVLLWIIIIGGIKSIQEGQNLVKQYSLDGFMIGREAYKNPYILSSVDKIVLNQKEKIKTRYQIAMKMADYIDEFVKNDEGNVHSVIRHILGLYNSLPGAKEWRRQLSENARFSKNGDLLRFATDNIEAVSYTHLTLPTKRIV